jgi:hypothetical protein
MTQTERPSVALRIAALCFVADAGFGIAMPFTLAHLAHTGELPMTPFGFRSFSGPFEQLDRAVFMSLGWALLAVCAVDVLAGVWIWRGKRRGARLGMATSPFALALGVGFALPVLLLLVPIRTGLVLTGWRGLR